MSSGAGLANAQTPVDTGVFHIHDYRWYMLLFLCLHLRRESRGGITELSGWHGEILVSLPATGSECERSLDP
jgi:hypothetical protein